MRRVTWIVPFLQAFVLPAAQADDLFARCTPGTFSSNSADSSFRILSIHARPQHNFTSIQGGHWQPPINGLNFCQVQVYLTHSTEDDSNYRHEGNNDRVLVEIWLPLTLSEWNSRLQATGGGGFATGMFGAHLGAAVQAGWAAVSTDGGHDSDLRKIPDASWALYDKTSSGNSHSASQRSVRWNLVHNFASRSSVDQIVIGKWITEQYFGKLPRRTYWNGCSTGGRQGYAIAQRYPEMVDGILASAPAINFANLVTAEFVPQLLMKESTYLSNCELEYFRAKAVGACDMLDGYKDGIIENPSECDYRAANVVGDQIVCDGKEVTITAQMADVVQAIHDGPHDSQGASLFPGLEWGVSQTTLANIAITKDGTRLQDPFPISAGWLKSLVLKEKVEKLSDLTSDVYPAIWARALSEFGGILNTDNPDLSRLRDSSTKMITWHGVGDSGIPYENTLGYRRRVEDVMGGGHVVDDYFRVFLAPGVEHCGGGPGPQPKDPLAALVDWVEEGIAPETLDAEVINQEGELVTKQLCAWPGKAKYLGLGDPKRASSWTCSGGLERGTLGTSNEQGTQYAAMEPPSRAGKILEGLKGRLEGLGMGLRAT